MAEGLDFSNFKIGQYISIAGCKLVKADLQDLMRQFAKAGEDLVIVSKDNFGQMLVAPKGEYSQGVLQVTKEGKAIGCWLPEELWNHLRPQASIKVGDHVFVRMDISDRIGHMATKSKGLEIVASDWHGYKLMIEEGDFSRGLLMVDNTNVAIGYWIPKEEYDKLPQDESR
eukprot:EG_transcript_23887